MRLSFQHPFWCEVGILKVPVVLFPQYLFAPGALLFFVDARWDGLYSLGGVATKQTCCNQSHTKKNIEMHGLLVSARVTHVYFFINLE